MTDKATDITDVESLIKLLESKLGAVVIKVDVQEMEAIEAFTKMAHQIYKAITVCVCTANRRMKDVDETIDATLHAVGDHVASQIYKLMQNTTKDNLDAILFDILLFSRKEAEKALGVPISNPEQTVMKKDGISVP